MHKSTSFDLIQKIYLRFFSTFVISKPFTGLYADYKAFNPQL